MNTCMRFMKYYSYFTFERGVDDTGELERGVYDTVEITCTL